MALALRMALRSVKDNWRHSLATLCSVGFGFCGVALLQGYILECKKQFQEVYEQKYMYGQVIVEATRTTSKELLSGTMLTSTIDVLKSFPSDLDTLVRFMPIEGIIVGKTNSLNFFGYAYDVIEGEKVRGERWKWDTLYGEPIGQSQEPSVAVGRGLAELLGCDFKGQDVVYGSDGRSIPSKAKLDCMSEPLRLNGLTVKGQINTWDTQISGVVDAGLRDWDDNWLVMPIQEAATFYDGIQLSMIGVHLKKSVDARVFSERLNARFHDLNLKVNAKPWQDHSLAEIYRSNMNLLSVLRNFILIIVILVSTLSMVSTISRSIMERMREIGTFRAIGYEPRFIITLFAYEGMFIGCIGSVFGMAITSALATLINAAGMIYFTPFATAPVPFRILLDLGSLLFLGFFLTSCSTLIATVVAKLRSNREIVEALAS